MKLVFVIGTLQGGGAEHVLTTVCNNLAERGHEVYLIYDFDWKVYHVSEKVIQLDSKTFENDTSKGSIIKRFYNKFTNRIRALIFYRRFFKEIRPDVVTCFLQNWAWQLAIICSIMKIPLVYSERNTFDWNYKYLRDKIVKNIWYHFGSAITVMTYYDKAFLRNRYKKVFVMHNPLSYTPLTREEFENTFINRKNILACGRLVPDKGFDKLIKSFAKIADDCPGWNIDIAGQDMRNSNYSEYLKQLVSEYGLNHRIRFIGFHKDINQLMIKHSIFCLCSQHEGFPNVLSEALSMGMAAISYDIVTGPREIIVDGLDGMIVKNQDIDALSDGLKILIKDEKRRKDYGLKAIENIKRFQVDRTIDKWEEMYRSLLR